MPPISSVAPPTIHFLSLSLPSVPRLICQSLSRPRKKKIKTRMEPAWTRLFHACIPRIPAGGRITHGAFAQKKSARPQFNEKASHCLSPLPKFKVAWSRRRGPRRLRAGNVRSYSPVHLTLDRGRCYEPYQRIQRWQKYGWILFLVNLFFALRFARKKTLILFSSFCLFHLRSDLLAIGRYVTNERSGS